VTNSGFIFGTSHFPLRSLCFSDDSFYSAASGDYIISKCWGNAIMHGNIWIRYNYFISKG